MPTANEELVDLGIRHAVHLARLRRQTSNEVLAFLNDDVLPDLQAKLAARLERTASRGFETGPWTTKRLRETIRVTRAQLASGMDKAGEMLVADLQEIGVTEAQWQAAKINSAIPRGLDLRASVPTTRQVNSIINSRPFEGDLLKKWWKKLSVSAQNNLSQQIQIGITEGETASQIVRRLAGTQAGGFMDGTFGGLRRNAAATVQTATNHMSTHAREMTYEANSDIVKGVQIVATLDARTTEICMEQDGKVYDINEGPRPPFHWNCRSTTVPVLKSLKEMGYKDPKLPPATRASMRGQVPARQTYGTWLRKQPAPVQNDILGITKAKLYRKHRLDVSAFVDDKRRVLTLKELRKREGLGKISAPRKKPTALRGLGDPQSKAYGKWVGTLSDDEVRALNEWSWSEYWKVRLLQRDGEAAFIKQLGRNELSNVQKLTRDMESALRRAPRQPGIVYRGLMEVEPEDFRRFATADTVNLKAFTSTSTKRSIAKDLAVGDNPVLLQIKQRSGANISGARLEHDLRLQSEVVLDKDTSYRVTGRKTVGDRLVLDLEEVGDAGWK